MEQVDKDAQTRMGVAARILGMKRVDEEWEYFQENARNFQKGQEDPNKAYGILIMNAEPKDENMLYAADPGILRAMHLEALVEGRGDSTGAQVRRHLDWLERMEGKQ